MPSWTDMTAGSGWGLDLGVVYEHTLDDAERFVPHRSAADASPWTMTCASAFR